MKKAILTLIIFAAGTVAGSAGTYFYLNQGTSAGRSDWLVRMDKKLDRDVLHLINGAVIDGSIIEEDDSSVQILVGSGVVEFLKSEIKEINRNVYARYVRNTL